MMSVRLKSSAIVYSSRGGNASEFVG
jgi:hypothetical protein